MKLLPGWAVCVSWAVLQPRPPRSSRADPLVHLSLSVLTATRCSPLPSAQRVKSQVPAVQSCWQ